MLTLGALERVFCVQAIEPVLTSIEWYNPQGQLVSSNYRDDVHQAGDRVKAAILTFQSYQQSQGGKYECRVAGPGNKTEGLLVYISESYSLIQLYLV